MPFAKKAIARARRAFYQSVRDDPEQCELVVEQGAQPGTRVALALVQLDLGAGSLPLHYAVAERIAAATDALSKPPVPRAITGMFTPLLSTTVGTFCVAAAAAIFVDCDEFNMVAGA